ncbi:MAG: glycosyltransferase family 4 protein [Saprospiraceae bacterium]|nr:glycosyltransferase family 4 protein [Saprospiraceae bacterium]
MNYHKIVFLNTHPIQYFAPMYQELTHSKAFDFEVWYCTRHGLNAEMDKQFGKAVKWDIPILEGYPHKFLKNHAPKPSLYSIWGIINLSIFKEIFRLPRKSAVVLFGWNNFTYLAAVMACKLSGQAVLIRCDTPYLREKLRKGFMSRFQRKLLQHLLFPLIDHFLYIGKQNKLFYQRYGVPDSKLVNSPYSVDNERFHRQATDLLKNKQYLKQELGLPPDKKIILFVGKLIPIKRPLDLIMAFSTITNDANAVLAIVGDGEMNQEIAAKIAAYNLDDKVRLFGFVNQSKIAQFYAVSDVLVLCSSSEAWGLAVNEAMNFGLPVIVSDMVGCADDLVKEGLNGFVVPTGDVEQLAEKLLYILQNDEWRMKARQVSHETIAEYSYTITIKNLASL